MWVNLLKTHRAQLDLSSLQPHGGPLDGSHTPAKNGGEAVGYQGHKAALTTNTLFLADNSGLMLACTSPQAGQHRSDGRHDLYKVQDLFEEMCRLLETAAINLKGLLFNLTGGPGRRWFRC